jgi:AcrR family transcriptional regulator
MIVAAAAELFAARGYAAVGMDEIGARVGITGPAIYRHFKGKEAVLEAVLVDAVATFEVSDATVTAGIEQVVGDAVAGALDRPAWLATYVRERQSLPKDRRQELGLEGRNAFLQWRRAMSDANPTLAKGEIGMRQAAILSALSAVALRPPTLSRPQLDAVLTTSLVSIVHMDGVSTDASLSSRRPWQPPTSRRDLILEQALALFRRRGFHGVGIDEIGEAAGITGPTVYFYFDDKTDILVDAFSRASARVAAGVHEALSGATSAGNALVRLSNSYAEVAADTLDLIAVTSREGHALPESERPRLSRSRREIRDAWVAVVREVAPEVGEGATRTLVAGAFPLMNQAVQRGASAPMAAAMARTFLLAPANK